MEIPLSFAEIMENKTFRLGYISRCFLVFRGTGESSRDALRKRRTSKQRPEVLKICWICRWPPTRFGGIFEALSGHRKRGSTCTPIRGGSFSFLLTNRAAI